MVTLDDDITENYIQELIDTVLLFFFNGSPLPFKLFRDWAEWTFTQERGWKIEHIKYLGKNFFVIRFERACKKAKGEAGTPWYLNCRYIYTFPWKTAFSVHTKFLIQAPVWIELQYQDLIYELQRRKLVEQLGPI
jgi:hypothetical protein